MVAKKIKKKRFYFRNIGVTATLSMSLVLLLVGLLALSYFITRGMSNYVKENLNLSIVLKDEVSEQQTNTLKSYLEKSKFAKSVEYITKEQALKDHIQNLGENPADFLGFNPLLASMEVKLNSGYANTDSVAKIEKQLQSFTNIDKVSYQKDMIEMVNDNIKKISYILVGLAAILMLISLALINNTVRLRIYSNRFLINTMKLVGAKGWFIRKPYIKQGIFNGVIAAIIALLLLAGIVYYFKHEFGLDTTVINPNVMILVSAIVLAAGVLLTAVSSYFAVGRYIRMRTDEMYYV